MIHLNPLLNIFYLGTFAKFFGNRFTKTHDEMKNKHLQMGIATVWILAIIHTISAVLLIAFHENVVEMDSFMLIVLAYAGLSLIVCIILVNDIYFTPIREKWFWVSSMFILLPIASITYLAKRKSLIIK